MLPPRAAREDLELTIWKTVNLQPSSKSCVVIENRRVTSVLSSRLFALAHLRITPGVAKQSDIAFSRIVSSVLLTTSLLVYQARITVHHFGSQPFHKTSSTVPIATLLAISRSSRVMSITCRYQRLSPVLGP